MPYPTSYDVTYSYTGFQQAQGDDSFPGTQLDADLAGLQANIESLTTFMGAVIRSDGALQNSIVTFDSLSPDLQTAGLAPAAAWATATQYAADANVIVDYGLYRAEIAHLSNVFATDLAAGRWVLVTNLPTASYVGGDGIDITGLVISIDATVATLNGAQILTNKTIDASSNTVSNLTTAMFAADVVDTDVSLAANSDTRVPTQKAVKAYADQLLAANDAMIFKGVIDCSVNPNYPAADRGDTYRVSVAGKIGGASGTNVENGDLLTCMTDGTAAGTQAAVGAQWAIAQANIDGAVVGPASVTDDLPAVFDGVTGKLIKLKTYAAFKTLLALVKGDVGLGNVANVDTTNASNISSGTLPAGRTNGHMNGTATNDNAAVGEVGEYAIALAPNLALTFTVTLATPAVFTMAGHSYSNDGPCPFVPTTSGALPTGLTAGTLYWTIPGSISGNTFQIATSIANAIAGTAVNTSGSQAGTHTGTSRVPLANNIGNTYAALVLGPGDHEIDGTLGLSFGATTNVTYAAGSISLVLNTYDSAAGKGVTQLWGTGQVLGNAVTLQFAMPQTRISVPAASTVTVYATAVVGFTVDTAVVSGVLRKRKPR